MEAPIARRIAYKSLDIGIKIISESANSRLVVGIQRAFEKMGHLIPQGGNLVSLGCQFEEYMQALRIFKPKLYIGVDRIPLGGSLRRRWENNSDLLGFPIAFVDKKDATEPNNVPLARDITPHVIAMLHPEVLDRPEEYRTMTKNWLSRLDDDGYMVITFYSQGEPMVLLQDPEIRKRVRVYGLLDDMSLGNTYMMILQKEPNNEEPIRLMGIDKYRELALQQYKRYLRKGYVDLESLAKQLQQRAHAQYPSLHYRSDIEMPNPN